MGFWSGVADGISGAAKGTWEGTKALAKGGYALATDSEARAKAWDSTKATAGKVADYAGDVYDDPAKAWRDARDGASTLYNNAEKFAKTADAEDWGNLVGAGVFEVGTALIPVGALAKAGKLGKLAKAGDKIGDIADAVDDAADAAKALKKAKPSCVGKCNATAASAKTVSAIDDVAKMRTRLNRLGYDDANATKIMNAIENGEQVVVVGENMRRVKAVSQMVERAGGRPVTYAPRNWTGLNKNSLEANRSWIRYWGQQKKAPIIDIGRQNTIRPDGPSPFYGLENRSLNRWGIYTPFSP